MSSDAAAPTTGLVWPLIVATVAATSVDSFISNFGPLDSRRSSGSPAVGEGEGPGPAAPTMRPWRATSRWGRAPTSLHATPHESVPSVRRGRRSRRQRPRFRRRSARPSQGRARKPRASYRRPGWTRSAACSRSSRSILTSRARGETLRRHTGRSWPNRCSRHSEEPFALLLRPLQARGLSRGQHRPRTRTRRHRRPIPTRTHRGTRLLRREGTTLRKPAAHERWARFRGRARPGRR